MLTSTFICRMFRDELEREGVPNIERKIRIGFQTWFRKHVSLRPHASFISFGTDSDMCVLHVADHEFAGYSSRRGV